MDRLSRRFGASIKINWTNFTGGLSVQELEITLPNHWCVTKSYFMLGMNCISPTQSNYSRRITGKETVVCVLFQDEALLNSCSDGSTLKIDQPISFGGELKHFPSEGWQPKSWQGGEMFQGLMTLLCLFRKKHFPDIFSLHQTPKS